MIDTFSSNSLKILDRSLEEFKRKYIDKLEFVFQTESAKKGVGFHALISYFVKGFNINKFEEVLIGEEKSKWLEFKKSKLAEFIQKSKKYYSEQNFYIPNETSKGKFYITGRFDLVVFDGTEYTIIDWKTGEIPKNAKDDIQTTVYFFAASKFFKTKNIRMIYYSFKNGEKAEINFDSDQNYLGKINKIISKLDQALK